MAAKESAESSGAPEDENKRKFREALERKKAQAAAAQPTATAVPSNRAPTVAREPARIPPQERLIPQTRAGRARSRIRIATRQPAASTATDTANTTPEVRSPHACAASPSPTTGTAIAT